MPYLVFNGITYEYKWWNKDIKLVGTATAPIAFDCETDKIRPYRQPKEGEDVDDIPLDPLQVPKPALAMAYSDGKLVLIHPSKLYSFFQLHKQQHFVGHNFQFDFWVVSNFAGAVTKELLFQIGDKNGLHDTMLLDMLLQLGTGKLRHGGFKKKKSTTEEEARLYPVDLGKLSKQYECGELDKGSEYRLRFGELLDFTEEQMDAHGEAVNFYEYALCDVIATYEVFKKQYEEAKQLMIKAGWKDTPTKLYEIRYDAIEKFGVLSEGLQTRASIVLAELSRTPLRIDTEKRKTTEETLRKEYKECLELMTAEVPELIKVETSKNKKGKIKYTKTGLPQFNNKKLIEFLEKEAARLKVPVIKSDGKLKGTSTSAKVWVQHKDKSPFIDAWSKLEVLDKQIQFLTALDATEVYSKYNLLMMNGRTSSGGHKYKKEVLLPSINIQQMPRGDLIRSLFLPPEGYKWYSCDYGYIELRTLAAVCRARFGWSNLADAIEEHTKGGKVDPHQRTAAMIAGLSLDEFFKLDKPTQKDLRQKAKACFHKDVETLTPTGWKKISEITLDDTVAQFIPETQEIEWVKPLALTCREDQPLLRITNTHTDLRVTPDHRIVGTVGKENNLRITVKQAKDINKLRYIWGAGTVKDEIKVTTKQEQIIREIVCIQADGHVYSNPTKTIWHISFRFKRKRKIERFKNMFPEATEWINANGFSVFLLPWKQEYDEYLSKIKDFNTENLLKSPQKLREVFIEELRYWDGHIEEGGKSYNYSSVNKHNVTTVKAIAAITGCKSNLRVDKPSSVGHNDVYVTSIKERNYTRSGTCKLEELSGKHKVYCLSVPSSYLLVQDAGKTVVVGNCNFGNSGGLGASKFCLYAKASYGVNMTLAEAKRTKKVWLDTYPEMKLYLTDPTEDAIKWQTGKELKLDWVRKKRVSDYLRGYKELKTTMSSEELDSIWDFLEMLAYAKKDEKAIEDCENRKVTDKVRNLFTYRSCTFTGRIRNNTKYTDNANSPFSGLAADGAKLALWNLLRNGFKLLSFIHDAIDVAVDPKKAASQTRTIKDIMCRSMESVIGNNIPVAADGELGDCWSKG